MKQLFPHREGKCGGPTVGDSMGLADPEGRSAGPEAGYSG